MKALLVVYDNDSHISHFPTSLAYVASVFNKNDVRVIVYNQDIYHYSEEHLTRFLDENDFNFVCVSTVGGYYPYRKLLKISEAINRSEKRLSFRYLLGGYGPSPAAEFFLKKTGADVVFQGDCEITLNEYLNGDNPGKIAPTKLVENLDDIDIPFYDVFNINYYRLYRTSSAARTDFVMPILSGRGCKFNCNFCVKLEQGQRLRSSEHILKEINQLVTQNNINYFTFVDDLPMSSKKRTEELCETFLKYQKDHKKPFKWDCNGRLNYAKPELLKLMKQSGCVFINYGIESFDNKVLKNMKKALTTDIIEEGVSNTAKEEINMGLNMLWGNIGDTKETLDKAVNFLLKYDNCHMLRTIRPVTPYPGSPLFSLAVEKGLLNKENPEEDFYENKHLNSDLLSVNFTDIPAEEFHNLLYIANSQLIQNYSNIRAVRALVEAGDLYLRQNINFREFRQV